MKPRNFGVLPTDITPYSVGPDVTSPEFLRQLDTAGLLNLILLRLNDISSLNTINRNFNTTVAQIGKVPTVLLQPANKGTFIILNQNATTLYIGNSAVTVNNGWPIQQGIPERVVILENSTIYGIALKSVNINLIQLM